MRFLSLFRKRSTNNKTKKSPSPVRRNISNVVKSGVDRWAARARNTIAIRKQLAAASRISELQNKYKNNRAALEKKLENAQKANSRNNENARKLRAELNALHNKYKINRQTAFMLLRSAHGVHERTMY
jgi:hypothetical protein